MTTHERAKQRERVHADALAEGLDNLAKSLERAAAEARRHATEVRRRSANDQRPNYETYMMRADGAIRDLVNIMPNTPVGALMEAACDAEQARKESDR
jgi:hypothetical protein